MGLASHKALMLYINIVLYYFIAATHLRRWALCCEASSFRSISLVSGIVSSLVTQAGEWLIVRDGAIGGSAPLILRLGAG